MSSPGVAFAALLLVFYLGASAASDPLSGPALRYDGVDVCRRAISTSSPEAQAWFNQGLTLLYGFNHQEALRSFHQATLADPTCAMAWWGLAAASAVDLNDSSMTRGDYHRGWSASTKAIEAAVLATPVERALAGAVATRFAWPPPFERRKLDEAYAAAMERVYAEFPDDPDVATSYADALMLLQPWDYWTPEHEPKGRVLEAIDALERALAAAPDHAGACHFLIHATEAGQPRRGEPAADALANRVPGSGHLLHMPSHIYVHVGRYADAADVNQAAIAADHRYFDQAPEPGGALGYYAHNVHMLAFSAMMEGREELALQAARELEHELSEEVIQSDLPWFDGLMATTLHVMVRFGRWEAILSEPEPPAYRLLSRAQRHYARGVALAALGRPAEARVEQATFTQLAAKVPEDWNVGANPSKEVLGLARQMLEGEISWREGRVEEAFDAMREGARLEDSRVYDEPPGWLQPVRHAFGALLVAAKRHAQAEDVYREDLRRNPGNGWSLLGLEQALAAQGKSAEASSVAAELASVWRRADVQPMSSCYCEPGEAAAEQ